MNKRCLWTKKVTLKPWCVYSSWSTFPEEQLSQSHEQLTGCLDTICEQNGLLIFLVPKQVVQMQYRPAKQWQGKQITESSGWVFISDNTSHSNNHVNHYLQQIHEHYDAYYVQNDFGHIAVLSVWADNCSEQFKSRYQLGWSVLYVNKTTLQVIHLFFFCPQHGKGPPTTPSRCY